LSSIGFGAPAASSDVTVSVNAFGPPSSAPAEGPKSESCTFSFGSTCASLMSGTSKDFEFSFAAKLSVVTVVA
jgi:hypothetical protein